MDLIIIAFSAIIFLISFAMLRKYKANQSNMFSFSIIISCRNEENNLAELFECLMNLQYPDYEIILVDDASEDSTLTLMKNFAKNKDNVHVITIQKKSKKLKGKKAALQAGVEQAKKQFLLFTDADCLPPSNWLQKMNEILDEETGMVVGYSPEIGVKSFRYYTQMLSAAIYSVTIGLGLPFSCSGRNLAVNKKAFWIVDGYYSIGNFESGDDKLLLNLIRKTDYKIKYHPRSIVYTKPQTDNFEHQQKRRYGKFSMSSTFIKIISVLVFIFYIYLPVKLIIDFSIWNFLIYFISILFFLAIFLIRHKEQFRLEYCIYNLIYPYYLIYYSIKGNFGSWKWKN